MHYKLLIFIAGILLTLTTETSFAGSLHADAGVTSDYVWRGLSQTDGKPAVQGGLEFVTDATWYFGAWVSNTTHGANGENSPELDYYVGLTGKGKSTSYDLGIIKYTYTESSGDGFSELYFGFMIENYRFKYSTSSSVGTYIEANAKYELSFRKDAAVKFHLGQYQLNNASDYFDANASLIISEFSLTISKATVSSQDDEDIKIFVSWNRSF